MTSIMKKANGDLPLHFGSLVDQFFRNPNRLMDTDFWGGDKFMNNGRVPVNIRETDTSFELEMVAPGLKKEDFHVDVTDRMLTVSFEYKETSEDNDKEKGYLRNEYRMQSFSRSFNLDDSVDASGIAARYMDGILYLTIPKKKEAQRISKKIEIQ